MSVNQSMMERLVFVKALHQEGVQQAQRSMPMASMSVLTFHDSIELFLYTGAEQVNTKPDSNILSCFNNIEQKTGDDLYGQAGIKRLREARAGLKHFANRPDEREIESFRVTAQSFFEENTPKIFGIDYSDIEIFQVIKFEEGREYLERASEFWGENKQNKAMGELALAHWKIMSEHRERARLELDYNPYPSFTPLNAPDEEEFKQINEAFQEVSEAMMYISLGIDYSDYARFEYLTPRLKNNQNSDNIYGRYVPSLESYDYNDYPDGSYEYCQNFLIELGLSLQNVDFDFETDPESHIQSVFDW